MKRAARLAVPVLAFAAIAAALLIVIFSVTGSALVIDRTAQVRGATIVSDHGVPQPLRHVGCGVFFTIPRVEGTIELRCRDGARTRAGYVTRHLTTRLIVLGDRPCGRVIQSV